MKGSLIALAFTVLFTVVAAVLFYLTPLSERLLPWVTLVILLISVFFGGHNAARNVGSKGLIVGLTVGLLFFIMISLLALVIAPGTLTVGVMSLKLAYALLAGILGGVSAVATM